MSSKASLIAVELIAEVLQKDVLAKSLVVFLLSRCERFIDKFAQDSSIPFHHACR